MPADEKGLGRNLPMFESPDRWRENGEFPPTTAPLSGLAMRRWANVKGPPCINGDELAPSTTKTESVVSWYPKPTD